jgi:multidrug transporter EmrE-like cation transporter
MLTGILLGLGAATSQSVSYLCSREFVARFKGHAVRLLLLSHVLMGLMSAALLPIVIPDSMPPIADYALPLAGCSLFYLAAQGFLFLALKHTDASRISPLLGLKVVILAVISFLFLGQTFSPLQWVAVGLSVSAGWMLNRSGGSLDARIILFVIVACLGYSLSDVNIRYLMNEFGHLGLAHASAVSTCLCYLVCGTASLGLLQLLPRGESRMWLGAVPFAISWFAAMLLLFACFASIGVVYGNIVQSSRGIISIGMGALIAWAGHEHLEAKVATATVFRRAGAACLMIGGISLFYAGSLS